MAVEEARAALEDLVREAVGRVVTTDDSLAEHRDAVAVYDSARDANVVALPSFGRAAAALAGLPDFNERIGAASAQRVTLQIIYDYFGHATHLGLDPEAFSQAFDGFISELVKPTWTFVSIANLTYFCSDNALIDFGDGMTIRSRNFDELRQRLKWTDWHLDAMTQEWMGFGASGHVIWLEEEVEKSPATLVLGNTPAGLPTLERLLLALRLYKDGDLNIGSIFNAETAIFSLRGGGLSRSVLHEAGFGVDTYELSATEAPDVRKIYDWLVQLDGDADVPQNVRIAFRRFGSVYARGLRQREDRILDSITALEALLGGKDELTFKLSFRVASILGDSDDDRLELLSRMKQFYRTRSRIVHGGELRQPDLDLVTNDAPLRAVLRRVLLAVLHLSVVSRTQLVKKFVDEELDGILIHSEKREALRGAMGLV
jgi:hypothetical protein